jgi:hypothetical protein
VNGTAIAAVISIMPATVPMPNTSKYTTDAKGARMVARTNKAMAADPARP